MIPAGVQSRVGGMNDATPGSRRRILFVVALGAIALHVVDDSFVQPQPGTSAGDHLVSGLRRVVEFFDRTLRPTG
jgi:hypothetical protein